MTQQTAWKLVPADTAMLAHYVIGNGPTPVIFLHGLGADAVTWAGIVDRIGDRAPMIAFDLPGHGESVAWPQIGHAGTAAAAVLQSIGAMGVNRFHLVGHSFGGATAMLVALKARDQLASLTLLAPGGFGSEINHRLLKRYVAAEGEAEILMQYEQFFGWTRPVPIDAVRRMAEFKRSPQARAALAQVVEAIVDDGRQGLLPRDKLADLGCPVKVIWGTQDRVLPTRQAHKLPGRVATHIFEEVGHMPHYEIADAVTDLVMENVAAGSAG